MGKKFFNASCPVFLSIGNDSERELLVCSYNYSGLSHILHRFCSVAARAYDSYAVPVKGFFYRNERYKDFGCIAAHIDDMANWIPARITALLMAVTAPKRDSQGNRIMPLGKLIRFILRYGPKHLSPNSGYPESALAGILNCRFGGSHNYFGEEVYKPYIGENHKDFTSRDMELAIHVNLQVEFIVVVLVTFFVLL